ncbi:MAG: GH3 auxin-responsive promoter family protein [Candidatus Odinarchaeum yellowstonii]|uniref:GH3 auxin-responsive promoter family protein n=1 Tax=Odinarchaeota yellowstonii (strain LCB_4) TaxID=1841599 RepID=A0AAF0D2J5_ODILC|nr:MAG: GH3 auxin-responsive promoter family protein [Candidatus Odinarchaeum yellowstonii]
MRYATSFSFTVNPSFLILEELYSNSYYIILTLEVKMVSDLSTFQKHYENQEKRLDETRLFQKAALSALYHDKWASRSIKVEGLKGFEGLRELPFTEPNDIRLAWENHPIEDIILTKNVAVWHCTSGSMGKKKWIPWSYNDYTLSRLEIGKLLFETGLKPDDIMLSITLPAPFISGSLPYRILESSGSIGYPIEQIITAPTSMQEVFELLVKRQPTVMLSTPSLALRIAEEIGKRTPSILKKLAEEKKSLKIKLGSFITRLVSIKPRHIFKKLRIGFFTAESLDPYRSMLQDLWGLEAFDLYGFTEGFGVGYECSEHNGLHFPSLNCILEIIPESELKKEENNPDYAPKTVLLSEAEKGLTGELVVTDFKEALPLIRYRIRDLVKTVQTDECSCGCFSPKLKVLGRSDDIVNMGVIRFSSTSINQVLKSDMKNGKVDKWGIYISRKGYKPLLKLRIQPSEVKDEKLFREEIFSNLLNIEAFKTGFEAGLFILEPFEFTDQLNLEVIGQGKTRLIRYSPDYNKPLNRD